MKPGAEEITTVVVGDATAHRVGNMGTPVVIAKDGDDVQARGEQVGAFVLLHLEQRAEDMPLWDDGIWLRAPPPTSESAW